MNIKEYLYDYLDLIPVPIYDGEIIKIVHTANLTSFSIYASFKTLQKSEDVYIFEKNMGERLGIENFSLMCKYTPDMFSIEYFSELILKLKRKFPVVNGFLDNANAEFRDEILTIELKNGGYDLLTKAKIDLVLPKLVFEEFSRKISVKFCGNLCCPEEHYEKMLETAAVSIPQIDFQEKPKQETKENKPIQTVTVNFSELPILSEGAQILKGSKIKENPVPIETLNAESGKVTVWGDVFNVDERESRDGEKVILSIYLTDYTNSIILKIIEKKEKAEPLKEIKNGSTLIVRGEVSFDKFDNDINLRPNDIMLVKKEKIKDNAEEKRVELHVHTNMSAM
ncbi:MAG TPA: hypothetical protein PLM59_06625, partial [Oscillospiraceae bacterium]|nr:hypothetical protein [Oscillospiraceae bacterium]